MKISKLASAYYGIMTFFFLAITDLQAQNCPAALLESEKMYAEGQLLQIETTLAGCMTKEKLSEVELNNAFRILILSYLYTDRLQKAEEAMIQFLKIEKEFVPSANDPAEFIALYNSIRTNPIISIGPTFGLNTALVQARNIFEIDQITRSTGNYQQEFAFHAGVRADILITPFLEVSTEVLYQQVSHRYENELFGFTSPSVLETQRRLDLPVSLLILPLKGKFKPYLSLGASAYSLLGARVSSTRTFDQDQINAAAVEGPDIDISGLRKPINFNAFAGIGFKYKVKMAYISLFARYDLGLMNQNNPDFRYGGNPDLIFRYGYIDNDFSMDNLSVSISYLYCFYKPKKK